MPYKKVCLLANLKKIQGEFTGAAGRMEKKQKGADLMFQIPHLLVLLATGVLVWWLGRAADRAGRERVLGWLKVCAVLAVLFDPIYWAWEIWQYGQIHLATTLPLYLCSLFCMMLPVAVFSKREKLRQMAAANVCTMGVMGGVLGLVFNVYLSRYPFFHFVPVRSLLYHILMVAAATLLWRGGLPPPAWRPGAVLCAGGGIGGGESGTEPAVWLGLLLHRRGCGHSPGGPEPNDAHVGLPAGAVRRAVAGDTGAVLPPVLCR